LNGGLQNVNRAFTAAVTLPAFGVVKHPMMLLTQGHQVILDIFLPPGLGIAQVVHRCGRVAANHAQPGIERQAFGALGLP
jgi:hypothetical protein